MAGIRQQSQPLIGRVLVFLLAGLPALPAKDALRPIKTESASGRFVVYATDPSRRSLWRTGCTRPVAPTAAPGSAPMPSSPYWCVCVKRRSHSRGRGKGGGERGNKAGLHKAGKQDRAGRPDPLRVVKVMEAAAARG